MTILGLNFGFQNLEGTVFLSSGICATTSWISTTYLQCTAGLLPSPLNVITYVVGGGSIHATMLNQWSFDAPALSYGVLNSPSSGCASVTVIGFNFGTADFCATAKLSGAECQTTSWMSSTMLACMSNPTQNNANTMVLSVGNKLGTQARGYSFDAPVASYGLYNSVGSGSSSVTLTGLNFGSSSDFTASAELASAVCWTSSWTTITSLRCASHQNLGDINFVTVTIGLMGVGT
jgi:hypothetical protein